MCSNTTTCNSFDGLLLLQCSLLLCLPEGLLLLLLFLLFFSYCFLVILPLYMRLLVPSSVDFPADIASRCTSDFFLETVRIDATYCSESPFDIERQLHISDLLVCVLDLRIEHALFLLLLGITLGVVVP